MAMSFYMPVIDLKIQSTASGTTLVLPNNEYRGRFQKLGVRYLSVNSEKFAQALLPKHWSCHIQNDSYETKLFLYEGAYLKAKIIYGLFIDVDFFDDESVRVNNVKV